MNSRGYAWGSLACNFSGDQMVDVVSHNTSHKAGQHPRARSVELRVAATLENLAVVRTLVAAIGTFEDLDFDAVADLRLAVDEACTRLIRSAVPGATLLLVVDPQAEALVVSASTTCDSLDILAPGSFSWHVLTSLTDEVTTFSDAQSADGQSADDGELFGISMTTRRASSLR
jgi:anti-sigma regulatory factor (Ser/Thr protein kinase)